MLNEKYLKMTSLVWQDVMEKTKGKEYNGYPYTGATVPHIIISTAKTLNTQEGENVEVDNM